MVMLLREKLFLFSHWLRYRQDGTTIENKLQYRQDGTFILRLWDRQDGNVEMKLRCRQDGTLMSWLSTVKSRYLHVITADSILGDMP